MDTRKCRGYVSTMFKTMRVEKLWRRQTALLSQADWEEGDKWLFPLPTTTNESRKVVLIGTFNSETHVDHVFVCMILLLRHCITLLEHALLVTYIVNSLCLRRSVSVSIYWKSRRNACPAIRTRLSLCLLLSVPQNFPPFPLLDFGLVCFLSCKIFFHSVWLWWLCAFPCLVALMACLVSVKLLWYIHL